MKRCSQGLEDFNASVCAVEFSVPFGDHLLVGNRFTPTPRNGTALILHGAGASTAQGFAALRMSLTARGIETIAFDFVGHGRTGGPQLGTTLAQRVAQVEAVSRAQGLKSAELSIIGFSMGAYVAVRVASALGAGRLCLAIPAAYAPAAFAVPFGPLFTDVLRRPRSWEDSDAFTLISQYAGHVLVLSAENDHIVPHEIPQKYASSAEQALSVRHHVVVRAGHNLSMHYQAEPDARDRVHEEIASLCLSAAP